MISIPASYEESRQRFRSTLAPLRDLWPEARLDSHALSTDPDLTIDWLTARARVSRDRLFILTTGEHGVEGYVGSAMIQLFAAEFLPRLDPDSTGLLIVHAINPWGMKHRRRVNANNVDLNRSFVGDPASLFEFNPGYAQLRRFLHPERPLKHLSAGKVAFSMGLAWHLARMGVKGFQDAVLKGQYHDPCGLYYGGAGAQEETRTLMALFREKLPGYREVVHLDMHTGFGPRDQMTLVNSAREAMSSAETRRRFAYERVAGINPDEFYAIQGDLTDSVYDLVRAEFEHTRVYSGAFEFGTYGDSLPAVVRSMQAMVFENQIHWQGGSEAARQKVADMFCELYCPSTAEWLAKASADARQAFAGILCAQQFIPG